MSLIAFVNGQFVKEEEARVSILDRGFLYGDGLFETMRAYRGKVFRISYHLERLFRSAERIFLDIPEPAAQLEAIIYETLERNELEEAIIRLHLTRGEGPLGLALPENPQTTVVVHIRPLAPLPTGWSRDGVKVALFHSSATKISEVRCQVKSSNYLSHILLRKIAHDRGFQEGIFLDDQGHVCEGTTSNIFLVKNGILKTPPVNEYVLSGITRQVILEVAGGCQVPFRERDLQPKDLYEADEIFLTNTGIEVLPVCQVDDVVIGAGGPGDITRSLRRQYLKIVEAEH